MIIGVAGPMGAGKTTVADLLKQEGFEKTSLSDALRDELKRRGAEITRNALRSVGDELRLKFGRDVLARRALEKVDRFGGDWVIESVRLPEEAEAIRERGIMIGVVAPDKTRYGRIAIRKRDKEEEAMSFDAFVKQDERDRKVGIDEALEICDYLLENDGSIEDLKKRLEALLKKIRAE